jgi:ornithine cyclodeaminase/alanine dehydrogenase
MTLILGPRDVAAATNMPAMIDVIEEGLREQAAGAVEMPPRMNLPTNRGFFRVMPAVMKQSGVMGVKIFNGSVEDGVRYVIAIYDESSGALLCLLDAAYLTGARTGATTGIATRYQAREDATTVGVIGSGLEARTNLAAVCAVRGIRSGRVFSPNPERRKKFAQEVSNTHQIDLRPADSAEAAVAAADIVIVATNTTGAPDPIAYRGAWMEPSQHVNSIGSTGGHLREIDTETFSRADRIAVDSQVQVEGESGDVLDAIEAGTWDASKVTELTEMVSGAPGRGGREEITLFKSVGTAVQDVMSGYAVYQEAKRLGLGDEVGDFLEHKHF